MTAPNPQRLRTYAETQVSREPVVEPAHEVELSDHSPMNEPAAVEDVPAFDLPEPEDSIAIADFSYSKTFPFTMDGETYVCRGTLPIGKIEGMASLFKSGLNNLSDDEVTPDVISSFIDKISQIFKVVMVPSSADRFIERLHSDTEPLDLQHQVIPLMRWIISKYGQRPTRPSSSSIAG